MKILVTGASGYIGGTVATHLVENGFDVSGLIRNQNHAEELRKFGIKPIVGNLDSYKPLRDIVMQFDGIINCADSDNAHFVENILEWYAGKNKFFIQTSGSSIVSDKGMGEFNPRVHSENNFQYPPEKTGRVTIDERVLKAKGLKTAVICPTMIYGEGLGPKKTSIQIPILEKLALEKKQALHIGSGKNVWSNVHIADLANLYRLVLINLLEGKFSGELFFAENGKNSFSDITQLIHRKHNFKKDPGSISVDDAIELWGPDATQFALASNSIVSSEKARSLLQWKPTYQRLVI